MKNLSEEKGVEKDGRTTVLDKHVIGMLFFEDFSRKKRIGKKAKTA
jgi:hypothetical protein